jgi:hypothetical protein
MVTPNEVERFVEALEQEDCVRQTGRSGPLVTAIFATGEGMTIFHWPIADHGFVPVTIHWEDRRVQFMPQELMQE